MGANLITSLQEIRDFRASRGRRYPLWLILLLVVMGTISGCRSYYALEDFGTRHYGAVSEQLGLTLTRLPSDTTFRRILEKLDFQALAQQFGQWASQTIDIQPQKWIAIDGKSIKGTVTDALNLYKAMHSYPIGVNVLKVSKDFHDSASNSPTSLLNIDKPFAGFLSFGNRFKLCQ